MVVLLGLFAARQRRLRHMHQSFDEAFDLDEYPEVGDAADRALDDVARLVALAEGLEVVRLEFLDGE